MERVRYMISDAADLVNVESHVLRYWEDELELDIPRNEMGHRYYTQENINQFQRIKELKEQGYQLKAIKMIVHNGGDEYKMQEFSSDGKENIAATGTTEKGANGNTKSSAQGAVVFRTPFMVSTRDANKSVLDNTDKMAQFTDLMTDIVGKAIAANNEALSKNISENVGEQVLKEMNYLVREQTEAEEDRFRKLDDAIRGNLKKKDGFRLKKWGKKKEETKKKGNADKKE